MKPSASRARSSELYYLGKGFKLSERYIKNKVLFDKLNSDKPLDLDPEEIRALDISDISITDFIRGLVKRQLEFGEQVPPELEKMAKKVKEIDLEEMRENTKTLYKDYTEEDLISVCYIIFFLLLKYRCKFE